MAYHIYILPSIVLVSLIVTACGLSRSYDQGPVALSDQASLYWTLENASHRISLALVVTDPNVLNSSGTSWVALGISEETSGSMLGADIASGVFSAGDLTNCTLADRHVPFAAYPLRNQTANSSSVWPNEDTCQSDGSWNLVSCMRNPGNGSATLEVERALAAHDDQDREIGPGDQPIIFAYGGEEFRYHGKRRGSTRVVLFNEDFSYPSGEEVPLPGDITYNQTVLATNYRVPFENVTTYACTTSVIPLPENGSRVMVAADPIINQTSGDNKAHHLVVYACPRSDYALSYMSTGYCGDVNPQNDVAACDTMVFVWAVGIGRFVLPEGVGFEIDSTNNYIIMETHYDNPDRARNAVDTSGVRLYFTGDRPIKAGVLALGDPFVSLEDVPVRNNYEYRSTCPSNCTETWDGEVKVFASFMHMHLTGRKMFTNHYSKNGTFIETINSIDFWSNDHQYYKTFSQPKTIRPGDKLSTSCIFDTSKRPNTLFGFETVNEMCIDFVYIYPRQRREPTNGASFNCAAFHLGGGPETATLCGAGQSELTFQRFQSNPTFDDTVGKPETFGLAPAQCAVAPTPPAPTPALPAATPTPPTPTPTPSASAASAAPTPACFPAAAVVETRRGALPMGALRVGDEVRVGPRSFSRVFMFTHRVAAGLFEFVELRTPHRSVTLSAGHYIYANDALVPAAAVRPGDRLRAAHGADEPVLAVALKVAQGLYNPQTFHGDIVVDGVTVSTYTDAVPPPAAHALLAPLRAAAAALQRKARALDSDRLPAVGAMRRAAQALSGMGLSA